MREANEESLKAEIEEIMQRVDTIMEKVARVMPPDKRWLMIRHRRVDGSVNR